MSQLESIIWHVLGYAAIPTILLGGFVAVALVSLLILRRWDQ
ncbi:MULTISPECIES: TIGR02808 family protein [Aliagarivorans]|nr:MULTISPECIES: TIGR02808 family protein [Aliagarivorans]